MKNKIEEIYEVVNGAIDEAVSEGRYNLDFYLYLKSIAPKRAEVLSFLKGSLVSQINDEVSNINFYLDKNNTEYDFEEVYGWMGEPRALKFKDYLLKIIEDAEKYEREKRPGRKRKADTIPSKTKNK